MGGEKNGLGWSATDTTDGVRVVNCISWAGFTEFVTGPLLDFQSYIYRGQSSSAWKLHSTLDRALKKSTRTDNEVTRKTHLEKFQRASLGRRGAHPTELKSENEWWALGQHYGLYTPLLDWTESPFVAAYFAYVFDVDIQASHRAVWALSTLSLRNKQKELTERDQNTKVLGPAIDVLRPPLDENVRLISQRGLFTRAPAGIAIEDWVKQQFAGHSLGAILIKIMIPNTERDVALRSLNRMNINHLSLFPDMDGASRYTNFSLAIDKY